jgi:ABC-2 type transport system ATP-binding protein
LHHPHILYLDEPTIGLDPQTRNHIWGYIQKLNQEEKITIFFTTHYMDEAEYCNRVSIMVDGKIDALDTPFNLKKNFNVQSMDEVFLHLARKAKRTE